MGGRKDEAGFADMYQGSRRDAVTPSRRGCRRGGPAAGPDAQDLDWKMEVMRSMGFLLFDNAAISIPGNHLSYNKNQQVRQQHA